MELLKLLSTNEVVAQIVSFLIVFFVLRALLWKRVLGILDGRREKISGELQAVEKAKQDTEGLRVKYEALLGAIQEAAEVRFRERTQDGEKEAQAIKDKARQDALKIIEDAKRELRFEVAKSRQELKDWMVATILRVSEDILMEKLSSEGDRMLIEDFLKRAEESKDTI